MSKVIVPTFHDYNAEHEIRHRGIQGHANLEMRRSWIQYDADEVAFIAEAVGSADAIEQPDAEVGPNIGDDEMPGLAEESNGDEDFAVKQDDGASDTGSDYDEDV